MMIKTNYDAAALPGATLAAVLAIFIPKGPYSVLSAIIGITLIAILFAFENGRERSQSQTFALSCVVALSGLLIVGFVAELCLGSGSLSGTGGLNPDSRVSTNKLLISWPIMVTAAAFYDRFYLQRRLGMPGRA